MTKTIEEVLAIQGGYKVDFLKEKMHDLCYTPIEAMRAMNEYAKQIALAFYECQESVSPEIMEGRFDDFYEKYQSQLS